MHDKEMAPPDTVAMKKKMKGLNATIKDAMKKGKKPFAKNANDWMDADRALTKARKK